jgi:DNA mismatch repair protein MutS2
MISGSVIEKLEFNKVLHYISNYSHTEKGKEKVFSLKPLNGIREILSEGELVSQAKNLLNLRAAPPFEYVPDLSEALLKSKIEGAVLEGKKIFEIYRLAVISRNIYSYLKSNSDNARALFDTGARLLVDKMFEHHIQKIINDEGDVKPNASPKLSEIKNEIAAKSSELVRSVNRLIKNLRDREIVREDYITLRDGRIVIPVKAEHKRHIRGFIHSESATGQTVYIEPEETLELNNEIISLNFAERREVERLLRELTKKIGGYSDELMDSLYTLSDLDSIFARAKYSIEIIGAFPNIDNKKPLEIIDARHPVLLKRIGREKTVPLHVKLNGGNVILITGPNAGGKTVVLKTIGLTSMMVQSGIHAPLSADSNYHFFNKILIDIGDEQSIEDDLSTFSSHLSNIKNTLEDASVDSLVLLDEIGTGTDPTEGSALAIAVLISLRNKKSTVFATTHHGSLKLLANELDGFQNAAMEFDNVNLKPTYVFKQGIPGSSYAFEIAERIGFKRNYLSLAKQYIDPDKHKIEKFLVELETKSKSLEEKLKEAELENSRLTGLSNLYKTNLEKLEKEKKDILKRAKEEAEIYLKDVNKTFEAVIKELKEKKADSETIKASRKILTELKLKNKALFDEENILEEEEKSLKTGDIVKLKNTETKGEILSIDIEKRKAVIKTGSIKMQVATKDLQHASKPEPVPVYHHEFMHAQRDLKFRIDIRGEKPEEAEFEVLRFVDEAYMAGLERIEILHGKGTGALKRTVGKILKSHDKVKNYYFAPIELGGEGVTIAELK